MAAGAKGIDSLAGKPGVHPALMEDLATGRMSVAQIAQRIRHAARDSQDGKTVHDFALVRRLLHEETDDILVLLSATVKDEAGRAALAAAETRYRKAVKIAMRWIRNYTELDFRSLGSLHPRRPGGDRRRPRRLLAPRARGAGGGAPG